jgi:hypothetical protein
MANISEPDMTIGLMMYSMTHIMDIYVQPEVGVGVLVAMSPSMALVTQMASTKISYYPIADS